MLQVDELLGAESERHVIAPEVSLNTTAPAVLVVLVLLLMLAVVHEDMVPLPNSTKIKAASAPEIQSAGFNGDLFMACQLP